MDEDRELMRAIQAGSRDAYQALYARWSRPLFAFLLKRTGARAQAEEAHQETWLRVFRSAHRYDPARPVRGWLFAIAANAGRDAWRREPDVLTLDPGPSDPHDVRDRVLRALQVLDPDERRILLLSVEGFGAGEIGQMLGLSEGAVRTRLSRARSRARVVVGESDA